PLDLARRADLFQFSRESSIGVGQILWEGISGELHGDRTESLDYPSSLDIRGQRAEYPSNIDAVVFVEPPVLDRDEGTGQMRRHLTEGDDASIRLVEDANLRSVAVEDGRSLFRPIVFEAR